MTIKKDEICDYVATRTELLLTKLRKMEFKNIETEKKLSPEEAKMLAISAVCKELELLKGKFCK